MKRFFLGILASIILISTVAHVEAFTSEEQNIIDRVITRWHARQPASVLEYRTQKILDRVNDIQMRARLTPEATELLNYVEIRLTNIINALHNKPLIPTSSNTVTYPTNTSTSFPTYITIPNRFDPSTLIIAGSISSLFQEIKYAISTEPMVIDEVALQVSRDNVDNFVQEFALYDENGNFVASAINNGRVVRFTNLNMRREPGSYRFYVALRASTTDQMYTASSANFTLSVQTISAQGVYSQNRISPTIQNNTPVTVTISPVGINTVQFLDTWNGYRSETYLSNGENTLGILEITTPDTESRYNQNLVIDTITIDVLDNTVARQIAYDLRLQRLDNQSSTTIPGSVQGNSVVFSLATLGNSYNIIEQGQNAVLRFTATPSLDTYSRESVQLSIRDLKNGGITYHLEGTSEPITTVQQWNWEIFGPRVSD